MSHEDELDIFFKQDNKKKPQKNKEGVQGRVSERGPVKSKSLKKFEAPVEKSKGVSLISMKAFIFNFKKFYKEKTKIRNLLSEPSAKQRNISLKIYQKNYQSTQKEVKNMLILTRYQEDECMEQFKELAFKDLHYDKKGLTHIYVRDPRIDELADQCMTTLDQLFMAKESAFFEKRTLFRFLEKLLSVEDYRPIGYEMLSKHFIGIQYVTSNNIQIIGKFIQSFVVVIQHLEQQHLERQHVEKQHLEQNNKSLLSLTEIKVKQDFHFKLVDIAHFLFENKYKRHEVEVVMKFITKVKQLYNKSLRYPKNKNIDGDQSLNLEFMTLAFNIISNKDKVSCELITELLHTIKSIINEHISPTTVERVRRIMEFNLVGDYLHKYFKDLDKQLSHLLTNIQHVNKLITDGIQNIGLTNKQEQLEVLLGFMHRIQESEISHQLSGILQKHGKTIASLISFFEGEIEENEIKIHSNIQKKKHDDEMDMPQVKRVLYADDEELNSAFMGAENKHFINPYKSEQSDQPIRRPKILDVNQIQIHRNPQIQEFQKKLHQMEDNQIDEQELAKSLRVPEHEDLIKRINDKPKAKDQFLVSSIKSGLDPYKQQLPTEYYNMRTKEADHEEFKQQLPTRQYNMRAKEADHFEFKQQLPAEYYNIRTKEADHDELYEQEFDKVKRELGGHPQSKDQMIHHLQSQIENLRLEVEQQKKIKK